MSASFRMLYRVFTLVVPHMLVLPAQAYAAAPSAATVPAPHMHTEFLQPRPEPNANDGQANPITTAQVTCGHVDSDDDKDYFSVQIGAGETWDITVDSFAVGSTLKGQLTLFDTDGVTELAYDDPTYPNDPIITHTFGAAGRYYLQVESDFYGTYDSGGYLLSFN